MEEKDIMVSGRWNEFKMIPESAYDVFVLKYNLFSDADEAHLKGVYDNIAVFRSLAKAEEHIQFILRCDSFVGLKIWNVDYVDDKFIYYAYNEDESNWTTFEIVPSRFFD